MSEVKFTDNSKEVISEKNKAVIRALKAIGMTAEGYAKENCPVDTGRLRNSISNAVRDNDVYIGTNVEYAPYIEYGTGIYADNGKGRKTPWLVAVPDDAGGKWAGKAFVTQGMKPSHFLKKAATEHSDEYKQILEKEMKK